MAAKMTTLLAERLTAQMLSGTPARDPLAVVERLLAVQGQDPRGARLAIRVRSTGVSASDVDRALTEDRSLLITWVNRGTLHLIRAQDYPWLHALTTPPLLTANAKRLSEEGLSASAAERGVTVIERSLSEDGPLSRPQLKQRIAAAGVRTEGQALVHLLILASLRGLIVRGPMVGREHAYVLVSDWLERPARFDRERALGELARRYLAGHGPADERDLAKWAGLGLRDARAGLSSIGSELDQRADGLLALAKRPAAGTPPGPRLLGQYDPLLLGWTSRAQILGAHQVVITVNGLFRPFALVDGKAVATWRLRGADLQLEPLGKLSRAVRSALDVDAEDILRYLGIALPPPASP